jgi:hypothetical protein
LACCRSLEASEVPSRSDRCCTAAVKKDFELISSQRSNLWGPCLVREAGMDGNCPTSVPSSMWQHSRDLIGWRAIMIFPRRSSCRSSAATRRIASWHLHVTRDHLHSSSVQPARIWHTNTRHPHTPRCGRPQGAVNAEPSMLNFGSPSPLLPAVPLGFVTC